MKIALISCTKVKQTYPCVAENMYSPSTLFRKARDYVSKKGYVRWFVLSARYGLLNPTDIIRPYDVTLKDMSKDEVIEWSRCVSDKINFVWLKEVHFYSGERYRKFLIPMLEERNIKCVVPLKGMGIGQQLRFYNEAQ